MSLAPIRQHSLILAMALSAPGTGPAWPAGAPAAALPTASVAAGTIAATVEQPRAFGHLLGDMLTQRVLLRADGRELEPAALPPAQRVGAWLERRATRLENDEQGRRWLAVDYQVVNVPQALAAAALPALTLPTRSGAALRLPEWPVSLAPMSPPAVFGQGALRPLQPDRAVAPLPTELLRRRLEGALGALALTTAAWLGWWVWRNRRDARRLPFARAWAGMRRLRGDDAQTDAWLSLHRALDETAGRVVHAASLPRLFEQAPYLQPLQPRLESFYRHSGERFFAQAPRTEPYPLLALCRDLRRAEKRHRS